MAHKLGFGLLFNQPSLVARPRTGQGSHWW